MNDRDFTHALLAYFGIDDTTTHEAVDLCEDLELRHFLVEIMLTNEFQKLLKYLRS